VSPKRRDILIALGCVAVFIAANAALFLTEAGLPDWTATWGLMCAAAMTFAIYSFLYRDNPFFRAAENLFVGLGLGVTFYIAWYDFFKPDVYDRLLSPLFDPAASIPPGDLVMIIPIMLGVVMLTRISPRYGWMSRYPIAFLIGYGAGFSIQPTFHSLVLKQVERTMVPVQMHWLAWCLVGGAAAAMIVGAWYASKGGRAALALKVLGCVALAAYVLLRNTPALLADPAVAQAFRGADTLLIVLGVVSVLCYFFFSAEHRGVLGAASRVGIVFLMVAFGASFGYTVMARESLVIGRIQFLLGEWLGLL